MKCGRVILAAAISTLAACGGVMPPGDTPETPPSALENGSFFASIDGREIHYEIHGSGPVVMTVPNSWGLSLAGLRGMYRPLEDAVTMVYFDPRGMGGSSDVGDDADMSMEAVRADFHSLRERLGLATVHAVGWSNGAVNLIFLAAERPETLESAIFVHGAAAFTPEDMEAFAAANPELTARWMALENDLQTGGGPSDVRTARMKQFWLDEYFPAALADPSVSHAAVRAVFEPAEFSHDHAAYNDRTYATIDAREILPSIPVRSLVIAGAADMIPIDRVRELADGLANASFVVFDSSGHFSPIEEADRFRAEVLGFIGVPVDEG